MIAVAKITVINPQSMQPEVLRVTSGTHFIDNEGYEYRPDLITAPTYDQTLFDKGTISGPTSVGEGDLTLDNTGGKYDQYRFYGFDGQSVEVWELASEEDSLRDDNLSFKGIMLYAEIGFSEVQVLLRSSLEQYNVAMQSHVFAGTNNGNEGLEGLESDIGGKIKPMVFGRCLNIALYPLNTSLLIFGCNYDKEGNRAPLHSIWGVYDKAGDLLFEGDVADAAALVATTVGRGKYKTCLAEGMVRLGTIPRGKVTCDAYESYDENSSAPRIVRRILESRGKVAGVDFDASGLDILQDQNSCPVGIYITSDETVLDTCTQLLSSIGAWMTPDALGRLFFGRVDLPDEMSTPSVLTITDDMYTAGTIRRLLTGDKGYGIPARQFELKHTKIWVVESGDDVLVSVSLERKNFLELEYRSAISSSLIAATNTDPIVKVHTLAPTLEEKTLLIGEVGLKLRDGSFEASKTSGALNDYWHTANLLLGDQINFDPVTKKCGLYADNLVSVGAMGAWQDVNPLDSLPAEIVPGFYFLRYKVVTSGVALKVSIQDIESGDVIAMESGSYAANTVVEISFQYTGSQGVRVYFSPDAFQTFVEFTSVGLYHKQYGLSPAQESERKYRILSADTERYTFSIAKKLAKQLRCGNCLIMQDKYNRFGMEPGLKFLVIGRDDDMSEEDLTFDIWRG